MNKTSNTQWKFIYFIWNCNKIKFKASIELFTVTKSVNVQQDHLNLMLFYVLIWVTVDARVTPMTLMLTPEHQIQFRRHGKRRIINQVIGRILSNRQFRQCVLDNPIVYCLNEQGLIKTFSLLNIWSLVKCYGFAFHEFGNVTDEVPGFPGFSNNPLGSGNNQGGGSSISGSAACGILGEAWAWHHNLPNIPSSSDNTSISSWTCSIRVDVICILVCSVLSLEAQISHELALEISLLIINARVLSIPSQVSEILFLEASGIFDTVLPERDLLIGWGLEIVKCWSFGNHLVTDVELRVAGRYLYRFDSRQPRWKWVVQTDKRLAPKNISSIPEALLESSVETEWRESGESQIEVMLAIYNYWK